MTITAYFGVDDFTTAILTCDESVDGCAINTGVGIAADLPITEWADNCQIGGAMSNAVVGNIVEARDGCNILAVSTPPIHGKGRGHKVKPPRDATTIHVVTPQ